MKYEKEWLILLKERGKCTVSSEIACETCPMYRATRTHCSDNTYKFQEAAKHLAKKYPEIVMEMLL